MIWYIVLFCLGYCLGVFAAAILCASKKGESNYDI